ncbi:GPCR, PTH-type protein [Rutstroemia sp. NJR-2017a WRK4]|nr:GPCR, PTH-type protein [Rutstroemia sp. NJR-2017a WRK4]
MLYPNALTAIIVCVTFAIISGVAVSLRTYAHRVLLGNPLRADDWCIVAGQGVWRGWEEEGELIANICDRDR